MQMTVLVGDLFESTCQTWVNTVNCVGVMGKGVALEFRKRFPDMYADYVERCKRGGVRLGRPYLYKHLVPPWILNFPTKQHWRGLSQLSAIVEGLDYLRGNYKNWEITSLAVPPLGCGQGQLEWEAVGPTLYRHLSDLEIPVELYAPVGTPAEELTEAFLARTSDQMAVDASGPKTALAPGLIAVVEALHRIEQEPHHWPVGRVMFQKLAYFATAEGLDTGLDFQRASFGPFAPQLKARITRLLNNGVIREEQLGRMFRIRVGPTYEDVRRRYADAVASWEDTVNRITDLFLRLNSTNQAELAASVHYAAAQLMDPARDKPTEGDVLDAVLRWKQRRRPPLDPSAVANMIRHLASVGWLDVVATDDLPVSHDAELVEA